MKKNRQSLPIANAVGETETSWHSFSFEETARLLQSPMEKGLTNVEADRRLLEKGPNRIGIEKHESFWKEFFEELREPLILLLLVTGVLYAIWGELRDALVIFGVILTLNTVEVLNEQRAKKAVRSLRKLAEPTAQVSRDGIWRELSATQIVAGDLVRLEAGRRVPADVRLLNSYGLACDESSLAGESTLVEKEAALVLAEDTPLAERGNLAFSGTLVRRGSGTGIVVSTGMSTELGRVARLAQRVKEPRTPLQKTMAELSRWMVWLALGLSVVVPALGVLVAGLPFKEMILTGLALAFATIPEELPIIITMVLALGAYRLSKQRAIIRRLKAVESLGAVTVIATDKTGTLTENRMEVEGFFPADGERRIRELGMLCVADVNDSEGSLTDPLDAALLSDARRSGMDGARMQALRPLVREYSFDNGRKCMSMIRRDGDGILVAVKGAPEAVLERAVRREYEAGEVPLSPQDKASFLQEVSRMGALGLRVIAVAGKIVSSRDPIGTPMSQQEAESDLTLAGLIGFADPPRPEVAGAVNACKDAGIRTVMITGDHASTARAIASRVGLDDNGSAVSGAELDRMSDDELTRRSAEVSIYTRTTPEHKLRIVNALRARGERVALTGDGVNDAPALAAADVGVAMGESGSDVAREAADIVLADDNFITITRAISEGRGLYENLTKAVRYYLACKVALVLATLVPVLLRLPIPFAPIQIILMELFMDLAASATFVAEPQEGDLMRRAPRDPRLPFMNKAMASSIFAAALGLGAAVTLAYLGTTYAGSGLDRARTVAFVTWILGHVLLALNMRSDRQPLLHLGFLSNRFMAGWAGAAVVFMVILVAAVPLHGLVKTTSLSWAQWALVIGASVPGTFWMEIKKLIIFRRNRGSL